MCKKFTLLELLVVVAVFAILLSLLLPSLQKARTKTRVAICVSNTKQISIGVMGHNANNSGHYPMIKRNKDGWVGKEEKADISWFDEANKYIDDDMSDSEYRGHVLGKERYPFMICDLDRDVMSEDDFWGTKQHKSKGNYQMTKFQKKSSAPEGVHTKRRGVIGDPDHPTFTDEGLNTVYKRFQSQLNKPENTIILVQSRMWSLGRPESGLLRGDTFRAFFTSHFPEVRDTHGKNMRPFGLADGSARILSYHQTVKPEWENFWGASLGSTEVNTMFDSAQQ